MWAYTQRERVLSPAFIAREHLLSPDQYELVDVRTRFGVRRALLFPKAILQAEFAANREVLASPVERSHHEDKGRAAGGHRPEGETMLCRQRVKSLPTKISAVGV
jgi:hypothetical protein